MTHAVRGLGLAVSLSLVSIVALAPHASAQSTTAAYVYVQVQGPAGPVYGYNASSTGQLTAIPGSPFHLGTQIIGGNKSLFFTLGKTTIHSYEVESNGAIGSQLSDLGYLNFAGSNCGGGTGGIANAVLDHTGQYLYVLLQNGGDGSCAAYQTYNVGSFTFQGDTEKSLATGESDGVGLPSILGNESFGYANEWVGHYSDLVGFKRESSGTLQVMPFTETDPTLSGSNYLPAYPDASPTANAVVVQLYPNNGGGDSNPPQLGSYTVDASGNLSTTNTSSNMPTPQLSSPYSTFSPDGTFIAFYGGEWPNGTAGNGIEIYNFNGPSPLTLNTRLKNGVPINQVAWDNSGHLYAISQSQNSLMDFDVNARSVGESAPVTIGTPISMVVVSQTANSGACLAPTSDGVNVCSPANDANVTSPIQISAAATVSGGVFRFELWDGSTKLISVDDSGIMDQTLSLAPGSYKLTFDAHNTSGTHEYAYRDITVQ